MPEISIGKLKMSDSLCLSPMAGVSSVTYRGICREFGTTYSPTELCSARSIKYNGLGKSYRYLEISPETEGITCIQLFGADPEDFEAAVAAIMDDELLSRVDIIDINMGCPVPKVVKTGSGSALIRTPELAADIVCATRKALEPYGIPVTVKTRLKFRDSDPVNTDFIRRIADAGASMIAVHGRSAEQMYSGKADIEGIAAMCSAVHGYKIPFFANGDIKDAESALNMLRVTGADGLMVGRAAIGNPWVFREISSAVAGNAVKSEVSEDERKAMLLRELRGNVCHLPENIAVREFRSVMPHYVKGMKGAAKLKVALCSACTVKEVEEILCH